VKQRWEEHKRNGDLFHKKKKKKKKEELLNGKGRGLRASKLSQK